MGGGLSGTGNRAKRCRVSRCVCARPRWGTWRTNHRLDIICGKELVAVRRTHMAYRPGDFEPSQIGDGHGRQSRGGTRCPALPHESARFFASSGWKPVEIHSVMHAAAKLKRLPFFLRLIAKISSPAFQPRRPWSAVCLLAREL